MRFMQIESVLQTKNRSEPAKNRFSVALVYEDVLLQLICQGNLNFFREMSGNFSLRKLLGA